ncbi:response regulator [Oceanimonas smirnovii]|uniref:response regulator n=1 Tax=Oceanimonas smirnovii TaxID=264574 RepID=UPI0037705966
MARWFSNLSLTGKIVLMVGLLSAMAVIITVYSLRTLHHVDRNYRFLLNNDAQAAMLFGDATLELSLASRVVLAVLTEEDSASMQAAQTRLSQHQVKLINHIEALKPLLPHRVSELNDILQRQQTMFSYSAEAVGWAVRWRGDKALNLLRNHYDPAFTSLKEDLLAMHREVVADYQHTSAQLNVATRATMVNSALAFAVTLIIGIGLTARLSLRYLSRPVIELTGIMHRLTRRDYSHHIDYTRQQDEIGQMAQALEVFSSTMQKAERLERDEAITKAKASFLANISHEIRTPMNAILGMTQQALKHSLAAAQRQRLEHIELAGQHLHKLINDLLDFSKLDNDSIKIRSVKFSPGRLVHDLQVMVQQQAEQKGLRLSFSCRDTLPELWGDPLRIRQILLNYLSNAIKFSEQGEITLRLSLEYTQAQMCWLYAEVSDEGVGIAPEQQQTVFTPFEQLDSHARYHHEGAGLGLAICRQLATLMGGETGVVSALGKGSTFWCRVKVTPVHAGSAPQVPLSGKRILVVDDNELNLLVVTGLLEEAGITVVTATSGEAALSLLHTCAGFDGVLLDLMMPGLSGLETCYRIRAQDTAIPVIALSANSSPADILQCFKAGMNGHIAKPIDEQQLWQVLGETLSVLALLDNERLNRLEQRMSAPGFARLLQSSIETCKHWQQQLTGVSEHPEALRQLAHDITGSAGQAGLLRLSRQAALVSDSLRNNDPEKNRRLTAEMENILVASVVQLQLRMQAPGA